MHHTVLAIMGLGGQELLLIFIAFLLMPLLPIVPLWVIFKKSGQNPWLSLLAFIPGAGVLIALFVVAFSNWQTDRVTD
ncbi:hypothetical protein [Fibrella forsythiae]|uniref:Uncharacterized protein n=1 Tax=Fibrella forsythiae TaxID=2817061 RepID=A0ABS3JIH2_9BACT|nr:hypothetical protein [Fibrella forsythiae]MBO0949775.1 hypothetical protein [Fibrella forsythiae]